MIVKTKSHKIKDLHFVGLETFDMHKAGFTNLNFVVFEKAVVTTEDGLIFLFSGVKKGCIETSSILISSYVLTYNDFDVRHPFSKNELMCLSQQPVREIGRLEQKVCWGNREDALEYLL